MADKKKTTQAFSVEDLKQLDTAELTNKVAELRQQLVLHQRSLAAQELPSTAVIRKTRKQIARILTILAQKQATVDDTSKDEKKEKEQ